MRIEYRRAIERLELLECLKDFSPVVIGTPPLGLDVENSDIDIACSCTKLSEFKDFVGREFRTHKSFACRDAVLQNRSSVVVQFKALGWDFELFCQSVPTNRQWGVRHFKVEKRLLEISPALREAVVELKRQGIKTEPAFASVLGLAGDPYQEILDLESRTDAELMQLITRNSGSQ